MQTTSEPAPGSLIASAPTCSPEISLGRYLRLLRLAAVAPDLVDAQVRVRAVGETDRRRGAADFLHRDDVREVAHRRAAVFLVDGDAEQAEVAQLAPQVGRELVGAVDLGGARRDLVGGELPHRRAQHVDRLAVVEVEGGEVRHRPPRGQGSNPGRIGYASRLPCMTISVCCISATSVRLAVRAPRAPRRA